MNEAKKYVGNYRVHCSKCGRFVGKDGFIDISYDEYMGGYEEGYSLCATCLEKSEGSEGVMDKTEIFVKMCEKAEEIQRMPPQVFITTNTVNIPFYDLDGNCWFIKNNEKTIWLPRQDQLQEIVKNRNELWIHTLNRFHEYYIEEARNNHEWCLTFDTPEKIWLAFVMKKRYNKTWNEGEWM